MRAANSGHDFGELGAPFPGRGPADRAVSALVPQGEDPASGASRPQPAAPTAGAPGLGTGSSRHPAETPTSAIVYGTSRPLVNLLLYALAEEANASFHWLDIRPSGEAPPELDPARLGWIDERRVWTVDPLDALAPDNARANAALFELVREDEPPATLARLSDFLRLPERLQQILAEMASTGRPGVLAVANVHRTGKSFPDSTLVPILEAIAWAGYSLFV